jgi:CRISPR-associated protein Csb1
LLRAGIDADKTLALQRYILGLSLVAFTATTCNYLRQGCMLVRNPAKASENEFVEVYPTGERKPCSIEHKEALNYAKAAAGAFGVGESKAVNFDKERAQRDIKGEVETKPKAKKPKKAEGPGGVP